MLLLMGLKGKIRPQFVQFIKIEQNILRLKMSQEEQFPTLSDFKSVLNTYNLRKLYQYLKYFVKNQTPPSSPHDKSTVNITRLSLKNLPIQKDRRILFQSIMQIFTEGTNPTHIIGVQRLIIGMMMLGHIHVFELMVGELLPFFVQAIEEDSGIRGFQSQLTKFGQSELEKPAEGEEVDNSEQGRVRMRKKLRQFYKQTLVVLAQWFPKNFYSQTQISWFKKIVQRHDIKCKFIVYFTLEKMNEYDNMIKKLKLNGSQKQCKQCLVCIQTNGEAYTSEVGQISMKNIPSIIEEQSQSNLQTQKIDKGKTKKNFFAEESDDSFKNHKKPGKNITSETQDNSKSIRIKEIIKRRREQKKSNLMVSENSISSRRLSKGRSSTLLKRLREKNISTSSDYFNLENPTNFGNAYQQRTMTMSVDTNHNETKRSVNSLRSKLKQKKKLKNAITDYYQLENKRKENHRSKIREKFKNTSMSQAQSLSFTLNSEKNLKLLSSVKNQTIDQIEPEEKIAFEEDNFKSLGFVSKKLFRKECLKRRKKILNYSSEGITLQICSKLKNSTAIQIKINFFSEYTQKASIKVLSPENLLVEEKKNVFTFDFEREFQPIVMKLNGKNMIIPILRTQLLEDSSNNWENKKIVWSRQAEIVFKLDLEVFQDISNVAAILNLQQSNNVYEGKFLYLKKFLYLGLKKENETFCKLFGSTELSNEAKLRSLLKEIKMCLQKRSAKPVTRKPSREKTVF